MLHSGPIPRFIHGIIEYLFGAALIVAPFVIDYDKGSAKATSIILGLALITLAAVTKGITGISDQLGIQAHAVLDIVAAVVLVISPFLFGFSEDGEPTATFVVIGVAHLLLSIGTRYIRDR